MILEQQRAGVQEVSIKSFLGITNPPDVLFICRMKFSWCFYLYLDGGTPNSLIFLWLAQLPKLQQLTLGREWMSWKGQVPPHAGLSYSVVAPSAQNTAPRAHRATELLPRERWDLQCQHESEPDCLSQTMAVRTWGKKIVSWNLESLLRIWIQVNRLARLEIVTFPDNIHKCNLFYYFFHLIKVLRRGTVGFMDKVWVLESSPLILPTSSVNCWVSCAKETALLEAEQRAGAVCPPHSCRTSRTGRASAHRGLDLEASLGCLLLPLKSETGQPTPSAEQEKIEQKEKVERPPLAERPCHIRFQPGGWVWERTEEERQRARREDGTEWCLGPAFQTQ